MATGLTNKARSPRRRGGGGAKPAALPLPHERDESLGQVNPAANPVIEQAAADLQAGQVDTDMRSTPGLDAERRNELLDAERTRTRKRTARVKGERVNK